MKKFAQIILDKAKRYGPNKMENNTTNPIWSQTETSLKNKLQEAQIVTKRATPKP
jgi:hypothetical protein